MYDNFNPNIDNNRFFFSKGIHGGFLKKEVTAASNRVNYILFGAFLRLIKKISKEGI